MDCTIEYLIDRCFETPFDFFQSFGAFWEERGWARIGHQLEDLFVRLLAFLQHKNIKELDIVLGLMKLDYLRYQKHKPRKIWWDSSITKDMRQLIFKAISERNLLENANLPSTEKNFFKHTVIETVPFDVKYFLSTNEIKCDESILIVYYDPKQLTASIVSFTIDKLQMR